MQTLKGKKALITGASTGIGRAIALAFAKQGADIVFSYRKNKLEAEQVLLQMTALGRSGHAVCADMSDIQNLQYLITETTHFLGGIDILVNNAGMLTRHADFLDIPIDAFDEIIAANLRAPFVLSQLAAKQMIQQNSGGSIINISSISAEIISVGLAHYECSKAGLHMLTKTSANALAKHNIRVNAIAPGLTETEINRVQRETDPALWQTRLAKIPLSRIGKPEDIAHMAVVLACDASNWMTGSIINIDGGQSIR